MSSYSVVFASLRVPRIGHAGAGERRALPTQAPECNCMCLLPNQVYAAA